MDQKDLFRTALSSSTDFCYEPFITNIMDDIIVHHIHTFNIVARLVELHNNESQSLFMSSLAESYTAQFHFAVIRNTEWIIGNNYLFSIQLLNFFAMSHIRRLASSVIEWIYYEYCWFVWKS